MCNHIQYVYAHKKLWQSTYNAWATNECRFCTPIFVYGCPKFGRSQLRVTAHKITWAPKICLKRGSPVTCLVAQNVWAIMGACGCVWATVVATYGLTGCPQITWSNGCTLSPIYCLGVAMQNVHYGHPISCVIWGPIMQYVATIHGHPRRMGMGTQNGYGHDRRPCPRHMAIPILTRPCPRKIFCLQKIFAEKKSRKCLEIRHLRSYLCNVRNRHRQVFESTTQVL